MAKSAAEQALAQAGRRASEVDLVIVGASSLQRPFPSIAIELQQAIGANGHAFDISVGCSSGAFAIQLAVQAIGNRSARCALICAPEVATAYANFKRRDSHFILGDGAGAVVVERADEARPGAFEVLDSHCATRFSSSIRNNQGFLGRCEVPRRNAEETLFYQEGRKVFGDIVRFVPAEVSKRLDHLGIRATQVARCWLHQANARLNWAVGTRLLGTEPRPEQLPSVLGELGNTAAAGALITFNRYHEDLQKGCIGVLAAFGAGYSMGCQILRRT